MKRSVLGLLIGVLLVLLVLAIATNFGSPREVEIARGAWGAGVDNLGMLKGPEEVPEAPTAIAARGNDLWILDQVNERILRYSDGKPQATVDSVPSTADDLAVSPRGNQVAILDRTGEGRILVLDVLGEKRSEVALEGDRFPEAGAATGIFWVGDGVWVERAQRSTVLIADSDGAAVDVRTERPGVPGNDPNTLLQASIEPRARDSVNVAALNRSDQATRWEREIECGPRVLEVKAVDTDLDRNVYIAALVAEPSTTLPHEYVNARIVLVKLDQAGNEQSRTSVAPTAEYEYQFRPISVSPEGEIGLLRVAGEQFSLARVEF